MSTTAPSKKTKRTNSVPSGQRLGGWVAPHLASSVGGKFLVALTGLVATGFVIGHMAGNLQIFLGQDVYNAYARSLKDTGPLLWAIRLFLLGTLILHMVMSLRLNWKAHKARPVAYAYEQSVQAGVASRHMVVTGLLIFAFIVFHIAHYTLGIVKGAEVEPGHTYNYLDLVDVQGRHDVYSMMIYGFQNPIISVLYVLAMIPLFMHLVHGVASMFQSVGLNSPRAQGLIRAMAWAVALVVCLGNVGIVLGVWSGAMPPRAHNRNLERATRPVPPEPEEVGDRDELEKMRTKPPAAPPGNKAGAAREK